MLYLIVLSRPVETEKVPQQRVKFSNISYWYLPLSTYTKPIQILLAIPLILIPTLSILALVVTLQVVIFTSSGGL